MTRGLALALVTSAVIALGGLVILIVVALTPQQSASFGWFAYQPLVAANIWVLSPWVPTGWVLFFLGSLGVSFTLGIAVGRRGARRSG